MYTGKYIVFVQRGFICLCILEDASHSHPRSRTMRNVCITITTSQHIVCDDTLGGTHIFRTRSNPVVGAGVPARPWATVCENVGCTNHPSSPSPTSGDARFPTHITPYHMATQGSSRTPTPTGGRGTDVAAAIFPPPIFHLHTWKLSKLSGLRSRVRFWAGVPVAS